MPVLITACPLGSEGLQPPGHHSGGERLCAISLACLRSCSKGQAQTPLTAAPRQQLTLPGPWGYSSRGCLQGWQSLASRSWLHLLGTTAGTWSLGKQLPMLSKLQGTGDVSSCSAGTEGTVVGQRGPGAAAEQAHAVQSWGPLPSQHSSAGTNWGALDYHHLCPVLLKMVFAKALTKGLPGEEAHQPPRCLGTGFYL